MVLAGWDFIASSSLAFKLPSASVVPSVKCPVCLCDAAALEEPLPRCYSVAVNQQTTDFLKAAFDYII